MANLENRTENHENKINSSDDLFKNASDVSNSDLGEGSAKKIQMETNRLENRFDKQPPELKLRTLKGFIDTALKNPKEFFNSKENAQAFEKLWENWDILDDFSKRQLSMAAIKYLDMSDEPNRKFDITYDKNQAIFIKPTKTNSGEKSFSIINAKVYLNDEDITSRVSITPWTKE